MYPHRVLSLLPSSTEIVCALGKEAQLVGRSHECDFPPSILKLPACTSAKVTNLQSSREINASVNELGDRVGNGLYQIDVSLIEKLKPGVILVQEQCEVCAVSRAEIEAITSGWDGPKPTVLSSKTERLSDLWSVFNQIGKVLGIPDEGKSVVKPLKNRVADVIMKSCQVSRRPKVFCMEWMDPVMTAGNWIPEMVEIAGGENAINKTGEASHWVQWKQVLDSDPDVILIMPCGFDMQRIRRERGVLEGYPGWTKLKAFRNGQIFIVDANQYFNRPGPRLVDSLEILAEILHPEIFRKQYEPIGWQRF